MLAPSSSQSQSESVRPTRVFLALVGLATASVSLLSLAQNHGGYVMTAVFGVAAVALSRRTHWSALFGLCAWAYSGIGVNVGAFAPACLWLILIEHPTRLESYRKAAWGGFGVCAALATINVAGYIGNSDLWIATAPFTALGSVLVGYRVLLHGMTLKGPAGLLVLCVAPYTLDLLIGPVLYPGVHAAEVTTSIMNAWLAMWPLGLVYYYQQKD